MSLRSSIAAAALLAAAALPHAAAQTAAAPEAAASAPRTPGAYRSAFDGYRPFGDQPVGNWRDANDTVGRIGGWQAYAREGQGSSAGGAAAIPAEHRHVPSGTGTVAPPMPTASSPGPGASSVPVKVAPGGAASGHSGHHAP